MAASTVILGAGLAGLSCAYHARHPTLLVEKAAEVGGTATSTLQSGFTFDKTGHWLHIRDPAWQRFAGELLGDNLRRLQRRAAVYSFGAFRPYPFQAHTFGMPSQVIADCVMGFLQAQQQRPAAASDGWRSFKDFMLQRLGAGFTQHFMEPYNRKLWTVEPHLLAGTWCERFVPLPSLDQVVHGALSASGGAAKLGYNAEFFYPRRGGIGALAAALADRLAARRHRLLLGTQPRHIDWRGGIVRLSDGTQRPFDALVATLPLPELIRLCQPVPSAVAQAAARLRWISVTYWNIGVRQAAGRVAPSDDPTGYHWAYYPDPHLPFYRTGSPSAVDPALAPAGCRSLSAEVSHPGGAPCSVDDAAVRQGLLQVGLLRPGETTVLWERQCIPHAYVLMDRDYEAARATLLQWLRGHAIYPLGRYGAWTYDSMEGALRAGQQLAEALPDAPRQKCSR